MEIIIGKKYKHIKYHSYIKVEIFKDGRFQVRNQEQREAFYKKFKALLKDATEVIITPKPKQNGN